MVPDFKFNHESDDFNESIGIDDQFQDEAIGKVNLLVNTLNEEDKLTQSRILEELIAICSDEQIAFLALCFIKDQIDQHLKNQKKKS